MDSTKYTLYYDVNGYNDTFTHIGNSQYAIDFKMEEGTKIYASREGLIVAIKNDGFKGLIKKMGSEKLSYIRYYR